MIWLGCNSDGIVHLKNVARKSGVHLDEETRDGAFCYIDANAEVLASAPEQALADSVAALRIQDEPSHAESSLHGIIEKVAEQLIAASNENIDNSSPSDWTSRTLIIVDDLTSLAWALDSVDADGHPVDVARELNNWLGGLTSLAAKVSCTNEILSLALQPFESV